jgi:malonyl-CoA/methylmalonyl-CoA synthetase
MVSGSAALPISVLEKWFTISGHILLERYGMTEIGMAISNPYDGKRVPGHIGRPLPNVEVRLVDDNLKDVGANDQGEILIKGPNVFKEYWGKPDATREAFTKDGWFKTGDIAINNGGNYKIIGRSSIDIIKSGGYKLSALEIEEVLREYELVSDCAVVGIPDEEWGEIVAVGLVIEGGDLNEEELRAWASERLAGYKIPRLIKVIPDLPRNAMGKVVKMELKEIINSTK